MTERGSLQREFFNLLISFRNKPDSSGTTNAVSLSVSDLYFATNYRF